MIINNRLNDHQNKLLGLISVSKNVNIRVYKLLRYVIQLIDVNLDKISSFLVAGLTISVVYLVFLEWCQSVIWLGGFSICH